ncbi:MAG TPA: hypothetical protein PLE45_09555 [Spirochaetota bacterium]|nr:hypothetical protein [Spirochaetota bacterium]HPP03533.1 hypothetical protein [Spirochaetota bacterium]
MEEIDFNFEVHKKKIEILKDDIVGSGYVNNLTKKEKEKKMEDDINFLKKYYSDQANICFRSKLYGEDENACLHASKVLMLFAEIYPVLVDFYGINMNPDVIINFQNSKIYRQWFYKVKYILGEEIKSDPDFSQIGNWLGKGFFLKNCLSVIYYSDKLYFNEAIVNFLIKKQKKLLNNLLEHNYFTDQTKKAIEIFDDGYYLLNEKTLLSYKKDLFFETNIIK